MLPKHVCPSWSGEVVSCGSRKAVFLDRDGVLIEDTGYPDDPRAIELLETVGAALRALQDAGWRLVVVSNQSGVARGRFSLETLHAIHERLAALLAAVGVTLDALYFCPHHPEGTDARYTAACDHRKPAPGMLLSAAAELGLELSRCWMVGDRESDVEAGRAAGCRTIILGEGSSAADLRARHLGEAASLILALPEV